MTNETQNLDNRESGQITIGACYASGLSFFKLLSPFKPIYKVVSEISENDGKLRHSPKIRIFFKWFNLVTRNFSEDTSSEVTIEKHIAIWFNEKTTAVEIINNFKSKTKFEKKRITDYFF